MNDLTIHHQNADWTPFTGPASAIGRVLVLDISTREEVSAAGMHAGAHAHVAFLEPATWDTGDDRSHDFDRLVPNPEFVHQLGRTLVAFGVDRSDEIILVCGSAARARLAVRWLRRRGYPRARAASGGSPGRSRFPYAAAGIRPQDGSALGRTTFLEITHG